MVVTLYKVIFKLLEILKYLGCRIIFMTKPAEYLQVLSSTARVSLEMVEHLLSSPNTSELTGLTLHPGEGR